MPLTFDLPDQPRYLGDDAIAGIWQSARTHGDYSLVNCSVSPGFVWSGLEMLDERSPLANELRAAGGLAH